jgi:acetyltransferase-like isoleucine patch superfamily enzyme
MTGRDHLDLRDQLLALRAELQQDMTRRHARDLPFDELVFDRWERARSLGFGEGASIYQSAYVLGDVRVGEGTWIGPMVMLDAAHASIEIGSFCSISTGVHVYTHDTVNWALTGGRAPAESGPVSIGDCTYVGSQAIVARGVSIGDHCVIGAQSFVNDDIEPYSVAVGTPARVIGTVEVDDEGNVSITTR